MANRFHSGNRKWYFSFLSSYRVERGRRRKVRYSVSTLYYYSPDVIIDFFTIIQTTFVRCDHSSSNSLFTFLGAETYGRWYVDDTLLELQSKLIFALLE